MAEIESKPNLNKMSLADTLADRTGLTRSIAYEAVETLFDVMASQIAQGGSISVTNFGSFSRTEKKARMARNPHTGDSIEVPSRKGVKFTASPRLVGFANSTNPGGATIRKNPKAASLK